MEFEDLWRRQNQALRQLHERKWLSHERMQSFSKLRHGNVDMEKHRQQKTDMDISQKADNIFDIGAFFLLTCNEQEAKRQYDDFVKRTQGTPIWMKAPNGKPTKMTEIQWVQTHTQCFKNWFGEWELAALLHFVQKAWNDTRYQFTFRFAPSEKLRNGLFSILGHEVTNVMITDSSVRHTKNHHGVHEETRGQKNIKPNDFIIIPFLLNHYDIIKNVDKYNDKIGQHTIEITKRINGTAIIATIEKGNDNQAFVSMWKKASPALMPQVNNLSPELDVQDDGGLLYKVKQDIEKIKSAVENFSQALDENGEPLLMFN